MNKTIKIFLIVAVVGIILGLSGVYYAFNKPHRNVEDEKAAFTMEATALYDEFNTDEAVATPKFDDQVIEVTGAIAGLTIDGYKVSIILNDEMEGIDCSLDSMAIVQNKEIIDALAVGDNITLKGKCDGFDMIMGVVLTRCFIIE